MNPKVIVITGASAGIGEALAKRLRKDGHSLVLAARRQTELERVAKEVGGEVLTVVADVTFRQDIDAIRDQAIARFGHIDVWVNNAGRGIAKQVMDLTEADVDDMMLVNVKSALWGMQAVVPHFQERKAGHVINVSSFLSKVPMATVRSMYSACKAALNTLAANLRQDLAAAHPGIEVSTVIPGIVLTEFGKNAGGAPSSQAAATLPPAMKAQTAEEVAEVIAKVIAEPRAEAYTNPAHPELARRYIDDVGAFEKSLTRR